MSTNFPTDLDAHAALVDNTDNIIAAHPNDRGDGIEALMAKVGVDSSAVTSSHDYKFTHLPGQAQNLDIGAYELRAQTLESDVATGTAPIAVASTTPVDNLGIYFDHATIASEARGDVLYRAASAWARRAKGTLGQVFTMGASDPAWATPSAGVQMATGTYSGNNGTTQGITGVGFQPDFVIILPQGSGKRFGWKTDQDTTYAFKSDAAAGGGTYYMEDHITAFGADGFTVGDGTGDSNLFNTTGTTYTYIAFKAQA